jgi:hypothetical protein
MPRPITRRVQRELTPTHYYLRKHRAIVVAFEPGDLISFRLAGCRHKYTVPLDSVFWDAARQSARMKPRVEKGKRPKRVKSPSARKIAKRYGVTTGQARSWLRNGLPILNPDAMGDHLHHARNGSGRKLVLR